MLCDNTHVHCLTHWKCSLNGTLINGEMMGKSVKAILKSQDIVQFGSELNRYVFHLW